MGKQGATYIVLVLIIILNVSYFVSANHFSGSSIQGEFGPSYFPMLLSIVLFILCAISFTKTIASKEDTKIRLPTPKLLFLTIILTGIFMMSASQLGFFYIQVFLFLFLLLTIYRFSIGRKMRTMTINIGIALVRLLPII